MSFLLFQNLYTHLSDPYSLFQEYFDAQYFITKYFSKLKVMFVSLNFTYENLHILLKIIISVPASNNSRNLCNFYTHLW